MSIKFEVKSMGTIEINGVEYAHDTIIAAYQEIMRSLGLKIERVAVIKTEDEK